MHLVAYNIVYQLCFNKIFFKNFNKKEAALGFKVRSPFKLDVPKLE